MLSGADVVRITETARDAWQGLPHVVPTDDKVAFIQALLDAGFHSVDVGSFVNPRLVPAMADTGDVLARLTKPEGCSLMALVANARGLSQLLEAPGVDEVLYPFSLSETFQQRNTNRGREQALEGLADIVRESHAAGRTVYATISMAFGNNEGDPWSVDELRAWIDRLRGVDVDRVGLADTTAQADAARVREVLTACAADGGAVPGVHLHCTEATQAPLVAAALEAGCRDFDAALGGLGGCQFAKGAESNVSTWPLVRQLDDLGLGADVPLEGLDALDTRARGLAGRT